jgi:hypothetical protein
VSLGFLVPGRSTFRVLSAHASPSAAVDGGGISRKGALLGCSMLVFPAPMITKDAATHDDNAPPPPPPPPRPAAPPAQGGAPAPDPTAPPGAEAGSGRDLSLPPAALAPSSKVAVEDGHALELFTWSSEEFEALRRVVGAWLRPPSSPSLHFNLRSSSHSHVFREANGAEANGANGPPSPTLLPPLAGAKETNSDTVVFGRGGGPAAPTIPLDDKRVAPAHSSALPAPAAIAIVSGLLGQPLRTTAAANGGVDGIRRGETVQMDTAGYVCAGGAGGAGEGQEDCGGGGPRPCMGLVSDCDSAADQLPAETAWRLQVELQALRNQIDDLSCRLPAAPPVGGSISSDWQYGGAGQTWQAEAGAEPSGVGAALRVEIRRVGAEIGRVCRLLRPRREALLRIQARRRGGA